MNIRFLLTVLSAAALAGPAGAQMQRRAVITGGGNGDSGRCVAEVVVDGAAEVEIRGDTANLRDLSGRQPEWRRFECTSPMPPNAASVQFHSNGRGGATLVASPNNGGPAVVRIQDAEGGAGTYQFELTWRNGPQYQGNPGYPPPTESRESERGRGYAVAACRVAIRRQAVNRFGTQEVNVTQITPDRDGDRINGTLEVRRGPRDERYPFSCSMDNGGVRTADIQAPNGDYGNRGYAARDVEARAIDSCRGAVSSRIGTDRVEFGNIHFDSDGDRVIGTAQSRGRSFDFNCLVNPDSGNVRNVDLHRR